MEQTDGEEEENENEKPTDEMAETKRLMGKPEDAAKAAAESIFKGRVLPFIGRPKKPDFSKAFS